MTSVCFGLALAACSGSDAPDAGPVDAGPADTGIMPDAGPPDTGVQGPCNAVDGTGCNLADNFCVLQTDTDKGECRELISAVGHELECNQSLQNCEAGLACLFLMGDDTPVCRKVCTIIGGAGCEGLTGSSASYACNIRLQGTRRHGFCGEVAPTCNPLDNMCPAAENCDFVDGEGATGCVPAGPVQLGGSCMRDRCRRGSLCATLDANPLCYEPCDLQNPMCSQANYQCGDIGSAFGLCVPN